MNIKLESIGEDGRPILDRRIGKQAGNNLTGLLLVGLIVKRLKPRFERDIQLDNEFNFAK